MRISSLQFGLIIAGVLLVAGVLAYNYWVLRRARGPVAGVRSDADTEAPIVRVEPSLHGAQDDDDASLANAPTAIIHDEPAAMTGMATAAGASMAAGAGTASGAATATSAGAANAARTASSTGTTNAPRRDTPPAETDDERWQIAMEQVATLPSLPSLNRDRSDVQRVDRRDATHTQPDPDIESVVVLRPPAPVGVNALAAALHARLGKPLRWFGRRDATTAWQRLNAESAGEFAEVVGCLLLADRSGPASRNQIQSFVRLVSELAPTLPATFAAPSVDDECARAEALDRLCAELDMQIGITIQKTDGSPIAGTRIRGVAEAAGFRLAPGGRFEWVQEETGNVVYTLQNMSGEPFTLDGLRVAALTGIVFVLDVPCVGEPARAFDQMKLAAGRLAHTVGGEMVDDNRRVLTDEALAKTRAAVVKAAAALTDVHIEPGSPRALKLFSA